MLRNAADTHKINIFSGGGDLYFYMGKIGIMTFSFINQRSFDFAFSLISKLRYRDPFSVKIKFSLGGQADYVNPLYPNLHA